MVYAQCRVCPREWDAQTPLGFWDTNGSPNLGRITRRNKQQKRKLAELWTLQSQLTTSKIERKQKEGKVLGLW